MSVRGRAAQARLIAATALAMALGLGSCESPSRPPDRLPDGPEVPDTAAVSCAGGTVHSGETIGTATWRHADSPHRVFGTVRATGALTLEPGVVVCAAPGSVIQVQSLVAHGTANAPVRLVAVDTAAGWTGVVGGSVSFLHVRFQGGDVVSGDRLSTVGLQDTRVEGGGVTCARGTMTLIRVHVEGAPGRALDMNMGDPGHTCTLLEATGVRLVGNGSIGRVTLDALGMLLAQPGGRDSLSGNRSNRVEVLAGSARDVDVPPGWELFAPFPGLNITGGTVILEEGVRLTTSWQLVVENGARLLARGSAAAPVVLGTEDGSGAVLGGGSALSHTLVFNMDLRDGPGGLLVDSSRMAGASLTLDYGGSGVHASLIADAPGTGLLLGAAGISARAVTVRRSLGIGIRDTAPDVTIDSCEVSANAGDGIRVEARGAHIRYSNLLRNLGFGVNNLTSDTVAARFNWWGDPVGPAGPAGNGTAGAVDGSGALAAPVALPEPWSVLAAPRHPAVRSAADRRR